MDKGMLIWGFSEDGNAPPIKIAGVQSEQEGKPNTLVGTRFSLPYINKGHH